MMDHLYERLAGLASCPQDLEVVRVTESDGLIGSDDYLRFLVLGRIVEYSVDWVAYENVSLNADGSIQAFNCNSHKRTHMFPEAPYAYGWVKWDGCIDMSFGDKKDYQLHFCGPQENSDLNRLLKAVWKIGEACANCDYI